MAAVGRVTSAGVTRGPTQGSPYPAQSWLTPQPLLGSPPIHVFLHSRNLNGVLEFGTLETRTDPEKPSSPIDEVYIKYTSRRVQRP